MKEYKVVTPKLGFRKTVEKLEDLLNNHAREGWVVIPYYHMNTRYRILFLNGIKTDNHENW